MKQTIKNYSFDKTAKTVTFTDFASISLDRVYLVTNVTSNIIVYQFNDVNLGGTATTNVLHLAYNTSSMANGDKLQIIYDCAVGDPTYDSTAPISGTITANIGTTNGLALDATLTGGSQQVQGNIASGATDSGNPLKIGAKYNSTQPTVTDGQRADLQTSNRGALRVVPGIEAFNVGANSATGSTVPANAFYIAGSSTASGNLIGISATAATTALGSGTVGLFTKSVGMAYNGTTYDHTLQASAAAATTGTGLLGAGVLGIYNSAPPTITNGNYERLQLDSSGNLKVNVTVGSSNGTSATGSAVPANAFYLAGNNGGNLAGISVVSPVDGATASPTSLAGTAYNLGYNGTSWAPLRTVTAPITTGSGVLATGVFGIYNSAAPTVTNGNYERLQLDVNGNLKINLAAGSLSTTSTGNVASGSTDSGNPVKIGGKYNATAPTFTDGQRGDLQLDSSGNLKSSTVFGQPNLSTATWTTGTSLNTALSQTCLGYGTATVTSVETGTTTTAGALTFEVYDGTNWWAVNGQQVGSYTVQSSYTLTNNTNTAWSFDVAGFQQFRVRLSTAITGTGSPQVVLIMQLQSAPSELTPTVGWAQKLDAVNDAITAYPFGHSYSYISTATTTTVKSSSGVLKAVTVNGGTAGTIIVYDNTSGSGTIIASFDSTNALAIYALEVAFTTGLTIVTGAATKLTVSYR